jgi:hypothetical protein
MAFLDNLNEDKDPWGEPKIIKEPPLLTVSLPETPGRIESVENVMTIIQVTNQEQSIIQTNIKDLATVFSLSCQLCDAVYSLANNVPPNAKNLDFWQKELFPQMTKALVDDVKAKDTVFSCASCVSAFAMTLSQSADGIKRARGSPVSIEVFQEVTNQEFKKIEEMINVCKGIKSNMVSFFEQNAQKLLEIVGPKVFDQVYDIDKQINEKVNEYNKMKTEESEAKAEWLSAEMLLQVYKASYDNRENAVNEENARQKRLENMVENNEKQMDNIPNTVTTTTVTRESGWLFWKWRTTRTYEVTNPNKDREMAYYNTLIKARNDRLAEMRQRGETLEELKKLAAQDLAKYINLENTSRDKYHLLQKRDYTKIEGEINHLIKKRDDKLNELDGLEQKVGLGGKALINCLSQIKLLSRQQKDSSLMLAPLCVLMDTVRASINPGIKMATHPKAQITDIISGLNTILTSIGMVQKTGEELRLMTGEMFKGIEQNMIHN